MKEQISVMNTPSADYTVQPLLNLEIKNLRLRTVIGIYDWERKNQQDIVINIKARFLAPDAMSSDDIADTYDYKQLTKAIIAYVEGSAFQLIEKLAAGILELVMSDLRVTQASVKVDKPFALRFADSVSIELSGQR